MNRRELLRNGGLGLISLVAGAPPGRARSAPWPDGHRGAVSLTYDDGLASQLDLAIPALERHGLRGTFYVTMTNIAHRLDDWAAAATRGQELADHTMHHRCGLSAIAPAALAAREVAPMEAWLRSVAPADRVATYAYPCDVTDLGAGTPNQQAHRYAQLLARNGIVAARTSEGEPNRLATALRRPYRLQALAVGYDAPDVAAVTAYLASAARCGEWAILVFHELVGAVRERGQVSADMHDRILDAVAALPLWCAPLGEVFAAIRAAGPR